MTTLETVRTVLALNPLSANDLLSSFGTIGVLVGPGRRPGIDQRVAR